VKGQTLDFLFASNEVLQQFSQWITQQLDQKYSPQNDTIKLDAKCKKKDQTLFDGEIICKIIRIEGPVLILVVFRDVTERIRTHEELVRLCGLLEKARDDALAGIRMKSLFLANVVCYFFSFFSFFSFSFDSNVSFSPLFFFN
jgi:hypothetical protein